MKHHVTFNLNAPGGYGGTHWFHTLREVTQFLKRAEAKVPGITSSLYLISTSRRKGR